MYPQVNTLPLLLGQEELDLCSCVETAYDVGLAVPIEVAHPSRGRVLEGSRAEYLRIVDALCARGAEGVILGCTEITLLLGPGDTAVPLFDTTLLHARAAVRRAIG